MMGAIARRYGRLSLLPCVLLSFLAVAATAQAADTSSYCINGHTETYDSESFASFYLDNVVVPDGGYNLDESGEMATDDENESFATQGEEGEAVPLGFGGEGAVFIPVQAGACAVAVAGAKLHNHSGLCYTKFSNDLAYFDSSDVPELLSRGYWVPSAVKSGDAMHLVCNPGPDMVATGTMVGADGATVVTDAFAGSNPGWSEILQPKKQA